MPRRKPGSINHQNVTRKLTPSEAKLFADSHFLNQADFAQMKQELANREGNALGLIAAEREAVEEKTAKLKALREKAMEEKAGQQQQQQQRQERQRHGRR
jgi:hypothetical protein